MHVAIILSNSGGELDRHTANIPDEDHSQHAEKLDDAVMQFVDKLTLRVGDTISIVEVAQ